MKNLLLQLCLIRDKPGYKEKLRKLVFLARRDPDAECSTLASAIWDQLHFKTSESVSIAAR